MHHICIIGLNDLIRFAITWGLVTCEKFRFNGTLCDSELFLKIKIMLSFFYLIPLLDLLEIECCTKCQNEKGFSFFIAPLRPVGFVNQ